MWRNKILISSPGSCSIFTYRVFSSSRLLNTSIFSSSSSSCSAARAGGKLFLYFKESILGAPNDAFEIRKGCFSVRNVKFGSKAAGNYRCWNCGAKDQYSTAFLFCEACRSVQSVDEAIDYFQIFDLRREYRIELEELERRYKDWQKKLHPDLVHSKSQREREYAAEQSARVIEAYRTLSDHLSRATYIMKLEGVAVDEEERITDPELLAEIMELREAVDEAKDIVSLTNIQDQLREKFEEWLNSFEEAYKNRSYDDALASIRRMTYYKRANEEIVKKL